MTGSLLIARRLFARVIHLVRCARGHSPGALSFYYAILDAARMICKV
jgi:hypothetical protein